MMLKKNDHEISLKYSLKVDMLLSLPVVQKKGCTPSPLGKEAPMQTSNGFGRIINLSWWLLKLFVQVSKKYTH